MTTCQTIMTTDAPVLQTTDTIGTAIEMMLKHRVLGLPVVDPDGIYKGMFAKSRLFGLMLPVLGSVEELLPKLAASTALDQTGSDALPEIRERLAEIAKHVVGTYADPTVPVLHPESPIVAAVLLVYRVRNFVAVVDPESSKLLGVVTTWNALERLYH